MKPRPWEADMFAKAAVRSSTLVADDTYDLMTAAPDAPTPIINRETSIHILGEANSTFFVLSKYK